MFVHRFKCVLDEELQCVHILNTHTHPCLSCSDGEEINWAMKRKCSDKPSPHRLKIQRIE
uniref:Uncharacterized protein n=1 Tax=Arion vulgaris TaxID=1028688 RepID=A0A0B6ZNJ6_9EUPU